MRKRVISSPLSQEVTLAIIRLDGEANQTLGLMEHIVVTQEEFMGVPFPRQFVALLIADATQFRGGGGPRGILTVDPGLEEDVGLIAHELAHAYWYAGLEWLREARQSCCVWYQRNSNLGRRQTAITPPATWPRTWASWTNSPPRRNANTSFTRACPAWDLACSST